jgi:SAM-dependent methyltransferase
MTRTTGLEPATSRWTAERSALLSYVRKNPLVSADESGEGFFGERAASGYDERAADMFEPAVVDPVVQMLADFAGQGGALEFGIGTGRIALPLAERGVRVAGIDNSEAMVARLRAKPGAEDIDVTIGDFARTRVGGEFTLVYLVFNTIFNLVTQDDQVACFANAAAHLRSGGRFVIETGVPDLQSLPLGVHRRQSRPRLRLRKAVARAGFEPAVSSS